MLQRRLPVLCRERRAGDWMPPSVLRVTGCAVGTRSVRRAGARRVRPDCWDASDVVAKRGSPAVRARWPAATVRCSLGRWREDPPVGVCHTRSRNAFLPAQGGCTRDTAVVGLRHSSRSAVHPLAKDRRTGRKRQRHRSFPPISSVNSLIHRYTKTRASDSSLARLSCLWLNQTSRGKEARVSIHDGGQMIWRPASWNWGWPALTRAA